MVNTFENACVIDNRVYFFSYEMNGLFEIDLKEKRCNYIGTLKKYNSRIRLIGDLIYSGGKIIMAPMSADDFVIYDLKDKTEKYIPVQKSSSSENSCKFFTAILRGTDVFFIGHWYPAIVKLDLTSGTAAYYNDWCKKDDTEHDFFRHDYCIQDEKIILPCCDSNKVMTFDMKDGKTQFYEVGAKERKYAGIVYDGKSYWLTPRFDNVVVKWGGLTGNEYTEIEIEDEEKPFVRRELSYGQSFLVNDHVIILPLYDNPVCMIDTKTDALKTISSEWIVKNNNLIIAPIRGGFVYEDKLYVSNSYDSSIYVLDIHESRFKGIGLNTSTIYKDFLSNKYLYKDLKFHLGYESIAESTEQDLQTLIMSCVFDSIRNDSEAAKEKIGDKVYRQL